MQVPPPYNDNNSFDVNLVTEEEIQLAVFRVIYSTTPPREGRTLRDVILETEIVVDYILSGKVPDAD